MTFLAGLIAQIVHFALMLAAAPVVTGSIRWIEARLEGRVGTSPLQPWRELIRLARKQPVIPENASAISGAAPVVQFAAIAVAALMVPSFALGMTSAPIADFLTIAGLLWIARFAIALAAMDAGTAAGGLGASRATQFAVFAEPALMTAIFTLAVLAGSSNIDAIVALDREGALGAGASLVLSGAALIGAGMLEIGVFDRPAMRFELAGTARPLALEFSGRNLALLEGAAALRRLVWLALVAAIIAPVGIAPEGAWPVAWAIGLASWAVKILALSAALALFRSATAAIRPSRIPALLGMALLLGLAAALLLFASQGSA